MANTTTTAVDTRVPPTPHELAAFTRDEVTLRAVGMLAILRRQGVADDEILATYCPSARNRTYQHRKADRRMERRQVAEFGVVLAPAKMVRARLREMIETGFDVATLQ